jgi:hypothetical protein
LLISLGKIYYRVLENFLHWNWSKKRDVVAVSHSFTLLSITSIRFRSDGPD